MLQYPKADISYNQSGVNQQTLYFDIEYFFKSLFKYNTAIFNTFDA